MLMHECKLVYLETIVDDELTNNLLIPLWVVYRAQILNMGYYSSVKKNVLNKGSANSL